MLAGESTSRVEMEETFEKIDGGRGDGWTGATQQVGEVTRIRLLGFELGNVGVAFEGLFHILHVVVFEVAHNFEDTLDLGVLSLLCVGKIVLLKRTYPRKNSATTHPMDQTSILSE